MKYSIVIFVALITAWIACRDVSGTSRIYQPLNKFIEASDVIAVVETREVEQRKMQDSSGNSEYSYTTEVVVKQVLKGEVSETLRVFHGKERDDVLFQQEAGLYLVFLTKNADGYTPFDGWPSSKHIKEEKVFGWKHHPYYWQDAGTPLQRVIEEINKTLGLTISS